MILAALLLNPYAGTYAGFYREGTLFTRPCTAVIGLSGEMTVSVYGDTLRGDCLPDGTFDVRSRSRRWVGSFRWQDETLIGSFTQGGARGAMWLTRQ